MKTLTIFTPTYNRAYILGQLYESLVRQTSQDFLWFVIDDGSTDETIDLMRMWMKENRIEIYFLQQENLGKMKAHNRAVECSETELFLCCDSDDYLVDNAVELILDRWNNYFNCKDNISGIIFPKKILNGYTEKEYYIPQNIDTITLSELHHLSNVSEACLTLRTNVWRQYPFMLQGTETFITEDSAFHLMDRKYKMLFLYNQLMVCEYRKDGYSQNLESVMKANPMGYAYYYNILAEDEEDETLKNQYLKEYILFSKAAKYSLFYTIKHSSLPWLTIVRMIRMNLHKCKIR